MIKNFQMCELCLERVATHFCSACGKWLCDRPGCRVASGTRAVVVHPIRTLTAVRNSLFNAAARFK